MTKLSNVINTHPNLKKLHRLIDKRGDSDANLNQEELTQYHQLITWYQLTYRQV